MTLDRELVVAALPGYDLGEELGRGAHGVVLRGTHRQLGRAVAIKQLPRVFGSDPDVRRRFLNEARALAQLDHPHIVPIYDFVESDGVLLLVMEHLAGGTLWSRMRAHGLDQRSAVAVTVAAAEGLEYAHGRGILHRDIKPDNLMFTAHGQLKVTDFGVAKLLDVDSAPITRAGYTLGTPAYMSPEQAQGLPLSATSDVYALATVLYEMLAGRPPQPHQSDAAAALYQRVHTDVPPLRAFAPDVAVPLADLVDRSLSRDPEARPPDAATFAGDLASAVSRRWGTAWEPGLGSGGLRRATPGRGSPTPATTVTPGIATQPATGRHRGLVAGAIGALLAALIGSAIWQSRSAEQAGRPEAPAATEPAPSGGNPEFVVNPGRGGPGEAVVVTSAAPCPQPPARYRGPVLIYVTLTDTHQARPTDYEIFGRQFPASSESGWAATVDIPVEAAPGHAQFAVSCLATERGFDFPGPYFDYPRVPFAVTPVGGS